MKKRFPLTLFRALAAAGISLSSLAAPAALARPHVEVTTSVGFHLPRGAVSVTIGDRPYYTHRGVFYRRAHHGYIVTRAPYGIFVRDLPPGYVRIDYRGVPYYRCDDVYYRPSRGGYIVVEAPIYVRHAAPDQVEVKTKAKTDPYASYRRVWIDERELFIKDGQFFRKTAEGLVWIEAPLGKETAELPEEAVSVWYQDDEYLECAGVYFSKTPTGYKVVESPWGS